MRIRRSAAGAALCALASAKTQDAPNLGNLLANYSDLSTFQGYIQKYPSVLEQISQYQGVTVLAPNNDAFKKLADSSLSFSFENNNDDVITHVLEYHILQGSKLAAQLVPGAPVFLPTLLSDPAYANVTGGQVVENVEQAGNVVVFISGDGTHSKLDRADLLFDGGVVQVIDTPLIPPTNVIDASNSFGLTSFEGALNVAGLIDTAIFTPNVTIFATANSGFEALGPAITNMTPEELAKVFQYTIVPGVFYSTELIGGSQLLALNGVNITVTHSGNNIYANSAQLVTLDILLANGVMHVMDNVLNPQETKDQPNPKVGTQTPVFASASAVTSAPFTNSLPCTSCAAPTNFVTQTATSARGVSSSSSQGHAAMPRETGLASVGLMAAIGGALLMV